MIRFRRVQLPASATKIEEVLKVNRGSLRPSRILTTRTLKTPEHQLGRSVKFALSLAEERTRQLARAGVVNSPAPTTLLTSTIPYSREPEPQFERESGSRKSQV